MFQKSDKDIDVHRYTFCDTTLHDFVHAQFKTSEHHNLRFLF